MSTDTAPAAAPPARALITIPGLPGARPLGGGCCAVPAAEAVRAELESWPGITVEAIDPEAGTAAVRFDPAVPDRLLDAAEALRDLGFEDIRIHPALNPAPPRAGLRARKSQALEP